MKRLITIGGLVLTLAVLACVGAFGGSAATAHHPPYGSSFERFLQRYEAANEAFQNGDPSLWMPIAAQKDPVVDLRRVRRPGRGRRRDRQPALPARGGRVPPERRRGRLPVPGQGRARQAGLHGGDRALQRPVPGQTERKPQVLRVTMIFRFDRGAWKIVHRHADTMVALQLPGT